MKVGLVGLRGRDVVVLRRNKKVDTKVDSIGRASTVGKTELVEAAESKTL